MPNLESLLGGKKLILDNDLDIKIYQPEDKNELALLGSELFSDADFGVGFEVFVFKDRTYSEQENQTMRLATRDNMSTVEIIRNIDFTRIVTPEKVKLYKELMGGFSLIKDKKVTHR